MWFKYGLKAQKLLAQGGCPGLGASALSGRAGAFLRNLSKTKKEVTREKRLPLFYDETGKA